MSAPSTSGLSVELLLRVIDVKYGCFTLLYVFLRLSAVLKVSSLRNTLVDSSSEFHVTGALKEKPFDFLPVSDFTVYAIDGKD